MKSFNEVINEGYLWNGEELHGNFRIDLGIFQDLCRDVGYLNCEANKHKSMQKEYEKHRMIQLNMFKQLMEIYENKLPFLNELK